MCFFDAFDDTLVTKNDTGTQEEDKKACFDVSTIKNAKFSKIMGYPWDKKTIFA